MATVRQERGNRLWSKVASIFLIVDRAQPTGISPIAMRLGSHCVTHSSRGDRVSRTALSHCLRFLDRANRYVVHVRAHCRRLQIHASVDNSAAECQLLQSRRGQQI